MRPRRQKQCCVRKRIQLSDMITRTESPKDSHFACNIVLVSADLKYAVRLILDRSDHRSFTPPYALCRHDIRNVYAWKAVGRSNETAQVSSTSTSEGQWARIHDFVR